MEIGMGLPVLGWWSRKTPDAPDLGFHCQNKDGTLREGLVAGW